MTADTGRRTRELEDRMQLGIVGLGRMGANMARRLIKGGHEIVGYAADPAGVKAIGSEGGTGTTTLDDFVKALRPPRVAWVMVPAGAATEQVVTDLAKRMSPGDTIVDGGNSFYKDDVRRMKMLRPQQIHYVDVGTSGGVWGLERGYCLMIGGEREVVERLAPIFKTLAPGVGSIPRTPGREAISGSAEQGYLYFGPSGAGHFVKMIHNGIEYGLMQAYAEGLDILRCADKDEVPADHRYTFDLPEITEVWRRGSVVGSWLLDLTAAALAADRDLAGFTGFVQDSGEGRWTVNAAIEESVPADVLTAALFTRFRSRQDHTFA